MEDPLVAYDFARFVGGHWRVFVLCCGAAAFLAGSVSLLLPKRYTATASLVIESPAGNDPRAATVISPVYLESLKTYERIASNDSLFLRALERFRVRESHAGVPLTTLKRRLLKVSKPASTKVLEISITLGNARQARDVANYIAVETVAMSKSLDARSQNDLTSEARRILTAARSRLREAEQARDSFIKTEPVQRMEAEVASATRLQSEVQVDLARTRGELAYYDAQAHAGTEPNGVNRETGWTRAQAAGLRARIASQESQERHLSDQLQSSREALERRKTRREAVETELRSARNEYEVASAKLNDIQASALFRGERLDIIDPGVIPEEPSFPNVFLNIAAALLLSVLASLAYIAFRFGRMRRLDIHDVRVYSRS